MALPYRSTVVLSRALLAMTILHLSALPAVAQSSVRSSVTQGRFPAPARLISERTILSQAQAALNAEAARHRLTGRCRDIEAIEWRGSDAIEEAAVALDEELERLDYELTLLPGGSDDSFSFTARKGGSVIVGTYHESSSAATVTWCSLAIAPAARVPSPSAVPHTTPSPRTATPTPSPRAETPTSPANSTARLPSGRYVCTTNVGMFPNMQLVTLGELRVLGDGRYQGVRHGGGGPVARYSFNPGTKVITWAGGLGTNFGILKGSSYVVSANGQPFIRVEYQSKAGGYTNVMTCQREGA